MISTYALSVHQTDKNTLAVLRPGAAGATASQHSDGPGCGSEICMSGGKNKPQILRESYLCQGYWPVALVGRAGWRQPC